MDTWIREGVRHHKRRRYGKALTIFEKVLRAGSNKEASLLRCDTLVMLRRFHEAIQAASEGEKIWPEEIGFAQIAGAALVELGRPEEALALLAPALARNPESGYAWHFHGRALMGCRQYDEALISFDTALIYTPENANTWFYRGYALNSLGRKGEAKASIAEALRLDPGNVLLTLSRARALFPDLVPRFRSS
ncbi:MAG: tetratricopeptide repeat protein [Methanocalculus sp. MSAO_Arc2]|uniref:tetratricopeptide repeat protein n=1 Tax=Methanocalculus sp. MSAO_Arc2 TaxID=2293855 RepID=UPI000FF5536E|nr:MAG: tetratricopeptide repeat protein [Methanocalculus sp. MSAO_Arc2]